MWYNDNNLAPNKSEPELMLLSLERFNVQRQLGSSSGSIVECEGKKERTDAKNSFIILTAVRTGDPREVSPWVPSVIASASEFY